MEIRPDKRLAKKRNRMRYRSRVSGTQTRPRLAVFRSLRHIYVQAVDDERAATVASACSLDKEFRNSGLQGSNLEGARRVGEFIGRRLKEKGIEGVVFDRGGNRYHGRVKAVGEGARSQGLKF